MISLTCDMTSFQTSELQDEDQALVQRFADGDPTAFDALVQKYRRQVYAVARRFTRNHEEADDLAQETFVRVYQNIGSFRQESSFRTWLLRITSNLALNVQKSGRIAKDSGAELDDTYDLNQPALEGILEAERQQALQRAIAQLPPKQRQTLLLKTYRDLTCEEVAAVMNCSVGTVKANVFNALKRLKSLLTPSA
jgi:RNA polymerase sigma-70 factor, ECF subfamily